MRNFTPNFIWELSTKGSKIRDLFFTSLHRQAELLIRKYLLFFMFAKGFAFTREVLFFIQNVKGILAYQIVRRDIKIFKNLLLIYHLWPLPNHLSCYPTPSLGQVKMI